DTTALIWDLTGLMQGGDFPSRRIPSSELQALWEELSQSPASRGSVALSKLVAASGDAVPFLQKMLHPIAPADPNAIETHINDLGERVFGVRKGAMEELEKIGAAAVPALRRALRDNPAAELMHRAKQLLQQLDSTSSAEAIQIVRALEVLERIGTADAVRI